MIFAQSTFRTFYEFQPVIPLTRLWQWVLLVVMFLVFAWFIHRMNRRDTFGQKRGIGFILPVLRLCALLGVLLFFLNPGLRSETRIVTPSQIAVLFDNSLSMGLVDPESRDSNRRIDEVISGFRSSPVLQELNEQHGLNLYSFSDTAEPVSFATLPVSSPVSGETNLPNVSAESLSRNNSRKSRNLQNSKTPGMIGLVLLVLAALLLFAQLSVLLRQRFATQATSDQRWLLAAFAICLLASIVAFAICDLLSPRFDLATSAGWKAASDEALVDEPTAAESAAQSDPQETTTTPTLEQIDWTEQLKPKGTSTRLGEAIEQIVNDNRGGAMAGIVVVTDGRNNSGTQPSRAIAAAGNAGIPVFPVGIGSAESPRNILVSGIQVPPRVFPGDRFKVKAIVRATGLQGESASVQLYSHAEGQPDDLQLEDEMPIQPDSDNRPLQVEFDVSRDEEGKRVYLVRVPELERELDPNDNERSSTVEIISRQTRVLLIAGGPTREFRFLRNQLYRDDEITLDVWLQTAKPGADQESDNLLFEFPTTREELFGYDCLIGFDPDWTLLDEDQATLLERWVAEKAGGMLLTAGAVYTPEWTRVPRGDNAIDRIRQLYPVTFYSQGSAQLKPGRFGGDDAFPLEFTREGRAAEHLWLAAGAAESAAIWSRFDGVFGFYAVNEPKPGADVLARFADPRTKIDGELPIYLASHYYGAGRVFFQASGEMWRVRRLDDTYFQDYYLHLLRWVSQGRLLRDSDRGVLLTDRDRCWMGDRVSVQAILTDSTDNPLPDAQVLASLELPDKTTIDLLLRSLPGAVRPGTFTGDFSTTLEGKYTVRLPDPGTTNDNVLSVEVEANIPDLEKENPQRNDELLKSMAEQTQGHYYVGVQKWEAPASEPLSPVNLIAPVDQESFLPGSPNRDFARKVMIWLLGLIVTALALEWSIRRFHKLA